jgi:PhoH-like ATPase
MQERSDLMDIHKPMRFYDTNILLNLHKKVFDESFYISHMTILELNRIKDCKDKDAEVKFKAREITRLLYDHKDKYEVIFSSKDDCTKLGFDIQDVEGAENDTLILIAACKANLENPVEFFTDDRLLALRAEQAGLVVKSSKDIIGDEEEYIGYKEIYLSEDEEIVLFAHLDENKYNCLINEYLLVNNTDTKKEMLLKWDGNRYIEVGKKSLKSKSFDGIKPKDAYQKMVIDSIFNNQVTAISGKAGSGKTLLALACGMHLIDNDKYNRIVMLFNPTSVRGITKMGYYGGTMIEKSMQSFLGNVLISKFGGDRYIIDSLLNDNKLKLVSIADSRGMEITGKEVLVCTEFQNSNIDIAKLTLSRVAEGAKVILEGDFRSQTDDYSFEGNSNGLKRAIDILKGEDIFGYVDLKKVYRSKLADLVAKM